MEPITKRLDAVADTLEKNGHTKIAHEIDKISDMIEKESVQQLDVEIPMPDELGKYLKAVGINPTNVEKVTDLNQEYMVLLNKGALGSRAYDLDKFKGRLKALAQSTDGKLMIFISKR